MKLERTDPAAAHGLVDQHFRRQAEVKARAMDDLRSRARNNLQSALELYAKLEERLQTDSLLRKEVVRSFPKSQQATALTQLDDSHQETQRELEDLQVLIKDLQSR